MIWGECFRRPKHAAKPDPRRNPANTYKQWQANQAVPSGHRNDADQLEQESEQPDYFARPQPRLKAFGEWQDADPVQYSNHGFESTESQTKP